MRSRNMQVLTNDIKARYSGVVIYGIGDEAHKRSPSGHNEDDTPGSKPEQHDADNKPEHRAIDVMIGPAFTTADAWNLVVALVTIPANRRRLLYVIFSRKIWRAATGWVEERYRGSDPHYNHPHISGDARDDENTAHWILSVTPPSIPSTVRRRDMYLAQVQGDPTVWKGDGFLCEPIAHESTVHDLVTMGADKTHISNVYGGGNVLYPDRETMFRSIGRPDV